MKEKRSRSLVLCTSFTSSQRQDSDSASRSGSASIVGRKYNPVNNENENEKMKTHTILCLLLVVVTGTFGQNIDSLKTELKNAKSDSAKCNILSALANSDSEDSENFIDAYLQTAKSHKGIFYKKHLAEAFNLKGCALFYNGNVVEAISYFSKSIRISEDIGNKKEVATDMINLAVVYRVQGDLPSSITQLQKAYEISDKINYKDGCISSLINLGEAYIDSDYDKSFDFFNRAVEMSDNKTQMLSGYYGIGTVYSKKNENDKAIEIFKKGLSISRDLNNKLQIHRGVSCIASSLINIGKYNQALPYALEGLKLSKDVVFKTMQSAQLLKTIYSKTNQPAKELEAYKLYIQMKDSINSQENRKAVIRNQIQTEYDKKALADSLRSDNEKNIIVVKKNAEIEHQQNQKMVLYVGLALVIIFSFVLFNRFQLIQKQKQVIEHHQKEITDSINYAKRLQEAILPSQNQFNNLLPENFVYYRPKDIVAGDFYWLENVDDTVYFAAADCTGHGVPGAMVSMVCSNALTRVVLEYGITEPGKILDEVRKIVIATFEKSGTDIKDGMDISLCALNKNTNELKWAGANNPLWYFQDDKMNEVKADKQPIGKCDNPVPFTTHSVLLQKGDSVFIFTDGYADQFGGPKGKKFMYKQMKDIIQRHTGEHMLSQKLHLDVAFGNWMNVNDQVDDVCVIGVRV